ncbi:MAG: multi-sensor hybrid histidine kinase, partial [Rhizobium sp.]|nr:multi-sensor hybrid histidine kinase [Rhizobium sp.]
SREDVSARDKVFLHPKLAARIPAYLHNCRQGVIEMREALDRIDFDVVTTLSHKMRGSGGAYGFQPITDIGAALELAAATADEPSSRRSLVELSSYLDRLDIAPV